MYRRPVTDTTLFVGHPHKGQSNPAIPTPDAKEIPVSEKLVQEETIPQPAELAHDIRRMDTRLLETKPYHPIRVPKLNELYSTMRTGGDWRYAIDNYAISQFTTISGITITVPITLNIALDNKRLMQWPGSTQLYLCLRSYSHSATVKTLATPVGMTIVFQDNSGMGVPILATFSDQPANLESTILLPSPIVDAGILNVGSVLIRLESGGTIATYNYMLAFSYAYLMTSDTPYERLTDTKGGPLYVPGSKADNRNPLT